MPKTPKTESDIVEAIIEGEVVAERSTAIAKQDDRVLAVQSAINLLAPLGAVKQLDDFITVMSLPPEAKLSVLTAAEAAKKLNDQVNKEASLPLAEIKSQRLIKTEPGTALSDVAIRQFRHYSRTYGIPLSGLNYIKGKVHPSAVAMRQKIHADPRILRSIETVTIMPPTDVGGKAIMVGIHAVVSFWNGESYNADGYSAVPINATDARMLANQAMIAETRAVRRAIAKALHLPEEATEDATEAGDEIEVVVATPIVEPKPGDRPTVLISYAKSKYGVDAKKLLVILGVDGIMQVKDVAEAKKKIDAAFATTAVDVTDKK